MDEKRQAARWRRRRIIFNNDGDDIHAEPSVNSQHDVAENLPIGKLGEPINNFSGPVPYFRNPSLHLLLRIHQNN